MGSLRKTIKIISRNLLLNQGRRRRLAEVTNEMKSKLWEVKAEWREGS